jgi:hypothetical protein
MARGETVYESVVRITRAYLGPATDRFLARQIKNHLHKSPSELTKKDLHSLIDWIKAVVSLLSEDTELIERYISELSQLSDSVKKNGLDAE